MFVFLVLIAICTAPRFAQANDANPEITLADEKPQGLIPPLTPSITDLDSVEQEPSLLEKSFIIFDPNLEWLSDSQVTITKGVDATARSIDGFFSRDESLENQNRSFLRMRLQPGFRRNHDNQFDFDVKFRIDLPLTKKKFRIVIGNDVDEEKLGDTITKPGLTRFNPTEDGSISAAIKAENKITALWRASIKAGIKLKFPLDPFIRATVWRRWILSETSAIPFRVRVTEFLENGTVANASINYEKILSDDYFFRFTNGTEWREEEDEVVVTHVFQLIQRIGEGRILEHNLGFLEKSIRHPTVTDAYVELDYRTLLHSNWLYLDIIPGFAFDREHNVNPEAYLIFRLEMFFEKDSSNRTHWYYKH